MEKILKILQKDIINVNGQKNLTENMVYFPITEHGEIGRIASTMNVGDIYGPLELKEGYSIFKLIDKQEQKIIPATTI